MEKKTKVGTCRDKTVNKMSPWGQIGGGAGVVPESYTRVPQLNPCQGCSFLLFVLPSAYCYVPIPSTLINFGYVPIPPAVWVAQSCITVNTGYRGFAVV